MPANKIASALLFVVLSCALVFPAFPKVLGAQQTQQAPPAPQSPTQQQPPTSTPQSASDVTIEQNVPYGSVNGVELHLDIYEPSVRATTPLPAVLLIHGGGWTNFDKSTMRGMGQFLARAGFVAFSVDYRLFHDTQNRWPAQFDDVQRAVRWIRANAAKYGVEPEHVGAFGHSSGAQLAALLGMEDTRDNSDRALAKFSSKVQAVVDVSGPTDFTLNHDAGNAAFMESFLGVAYSKDPKVWREASPVFHVSRQNSPFLIVHGTEDDEVPVAQAQELYDKLKAAGVPVSLSLINGGHTFRTPEARRQLAAETLDFFTRYLVPAH
jgi:acetyl esterase/lipase